MAHLQATDWIGVFAPVASGLAAVTAIGVSLWVSNKQRRIQQIQLQQSLYEKRYSIYLAVEEIVNHVLRTDGLIDLIGPEFRRFLYAVDQAQFLFGPEAVRYMTDVRNVISDLHLKCSKRDHLKRLGQPDEEASIQTIDVLKSLAGPVMEERARTFHPYLQLGGGPSAKEVKMTLNGWQRLWVVVIAIGLMPAFWMAFELWPTAADISRFDVYTRMNVADARDLVDYYDVLAAEYGGVTVNRQYTPNDIAPSTGSPLAPNPKGYTMALPPGAVLVSPGSALPPIPKGYTLSQAPGWLPVPGQVVNAEDRALQFIDGTSQSEMDRTTAAFSRTIAHLLVRKRVVLAAEAMGLWALASAALYLLGSAVEWVRRGFARAVI